MKSFLLAMGLATAMLTAVPASAHAWYCYASSPTGSYGWARFRSLRRARRAALYQCAIRTPRGYYCRIRYCR